MARRKPQIRRVDGNHREIVEGLEGYGLTVCSLHAVAGGCPDILVGGNGKNLLFELKVGSLTLDPSQVTWHRNWLGTVFVVNSLRGAFEICREHGLLFPARPRGVTNG